MACKGICINYKAFKLASGERYGMGQKRCHRCEIFIKWEGLWCPCCGYKLRTRPKSNKKIQRKIGLGK